MQPFFRTSATKKRQKKKEAEEEEELKLQAALAGSKLKATFCSCKRRCAVQPWQALYAHSYEVQNVAL